MVIIKVLSLIKKNNEKTFTNELSNPYINLKFYDYNYTVVNYTVVNIIDDLTEEIKVVLLTLSCHLHQRRQSGSKSGGRESDGRNF